MSDFSGVEFTPGFGPFMVLASRVKGGTGAIESFRACMASLASLPGTRLLEDEGDGCFLCFEDMQIAARAALTLAAAVPNGERTSQIECSVRLGIHFYSEVLEYQRFPRLAARIMAFASSGQIVLSSETARQLAGDWRIASHGRHVIYGLGITELFELLAEGREVRSLGSGPTAASNIPAAPQGFVGRHEVLRELRAKIRVGGLVVIRGPGGIGKTSLASMAANQAFTEGDLPNGAVWLNCEQSPSLSSLVRQIANVLPIVNTARMPLDVCQKRVEDYLARGGVLVVMDNFETVLRDPEVRGWLATLPLAASVIVTTRETPEDLPGQRLTLTPLPEAEAELLFMRRARAAGWREEVQIGKDIRGLILEMCQMVSYLPLAIELLAARGGGTPLQRLRDWLAADLSVLATPDPTVPERQQSISASMSISFRMLSDEARRLLDGLSFLPHKLTPESLHAVADIERVNAHQAAEQLARASLLQREAAEGTGLDGERFSCHELVRRYALESLKASRHQALERGVLRALSALAVEHGERTRPGGNDASVLDASVNWLEAEWGNLYHLARRSVVLGDLELVNRFAAAFRYFFRMRGRFEDCEVFYSQALLLARDAGNPVLQMHAARSLGVIYRQLGRLVQAEESFKLSLQLALDLKDEKNVGRAYNNLACVYVNQQEWEKALEYLSRDLEICDRLGDHVGRGITLCNIGEAYRMTSDYQKAVRAFEEALVIARNHQDPVGEQTVLNNLGEIASGRGEFAKAREYLRQSIRIQKQIGIQATDSFPFDGMGDVLAREQKWAEAERFYQQSLDLKRRAQDGVGEADTLKRLAKLHASQHHREKALELGRQALQAVKDTDDQSVSAELLQLLQEWQKLPVEG